MRTSVGMMMFGGALIVSSALAQDASPVKDQGRDAKAKSVKATRTITAKVDKTGQHPGSAPIVGSATVTCVSATSDTPKPQTPPSCLNSAPGLNMQLNKGQSGGTSGAGTVVLNCNGQGKLLTCSATVAEATVFVVSSALAQETTYTPFPGNQTLMSKYGKQIPGCSCGIGPGQSDHFKSMLVDPTQARTQVGQQVQIRYDASGICNGQGVAPIDGRFGTAKWRAGTIQDLPDAYGIIALPKGYSQASTEQITIEVKLTCVDVTCRMGCSAKIDIPVTVVSKDAPKAKETKQVPKATGK